MLIRFGNLSKYSTISSILGSMINEPTKENSNDLIIIRHAQSNFNKGFLDYRQMNKVDLSWDECIQNEAFNKSVSYAKELIDCSITQQGKLQCKRARESLAYEDIDIVLVSPYQRALETCREIFGGRNIKVEAHPILAEVFRYSCDISHHIEQKTKQFSNVDFSHMKDHSELWFIEILSEHLKNKCNTHFEAHGEMTFTEKQHKLLQLLHSKVLYQSPQELRMRTWRIKELLTQYKKKYKKIAIVSHFYTIATLTATKFNEIGQVIDFQEIFNATPIYTSVEKLLSVK